MKELIINFLSCFL